MANVVEVSIRGEQDLSGVLRGVREQARRDVGDAFDKAGERADDMDTRAMGFRDTMTGVADTTLGASQIAKGNLFEGFLTLGMGIGDLGSGLYNFVIPGFKSFAAGGLRGKVANVRASVAAHAHRVAERARGVAAVAAAAASRLASLALRNTPLLLIIAALTAAVMTLYRRSDTVRRLVDRLWKTMRAAFRSSVEWLRGRFSDLRRWFGRLGDRFRDLMGRARDTMTQLRATVRDAVAAVVRALGRAGSAVHSAVADAHRRISGALDGLRTFVVNPMVGAFNALPGVSISPLGAFGFRALRRRHGGRIPGRGNSDNVPVLATPGEHVMTKEEVRRAGGHAAVERLRAGLRRRRRLWMHPTGGDPQRMAQGGVVGARAMAKRLHGRPYVWGGLDCSGYMSAILNAWEGKNSLARRFTTATIRAGNGLASGLATKRGNFNIGSYRGNPGHMAGTLDGVPVESGGGHGVMYGQSASGAEHPRFTMKFHATGGFDWRGWIKKKIAGLIDRITSHLSGDGLVMGIARAVIRMARDWVLGSFASGVDRVPRGGLAEVHAGETIAPHGEPVVFEVVADDDAWRRWCNEQIRRDVHAAAGGDVQRYVTARG